MGHARDASGRSLANAAATALSSGLPASLGRAAAATAEPALGVVAESRRQREQQEHLLLKAQEELQKASRNAQVAVERRAGGPPEADSRKTPATRSGKVRAQSPRTRAVRPVLRGPVPSARQRSGSGEVTAIDGRPASGVSASLRAAAALSPHRGFYHASSATSLRNSRQQGSRLAWTAPAATPGLGSASPEPTPLAEPEEEKAEKADQDEPSQCSSIQPSPSWKRLEKTVTAYVSRRNVSSSEYEQVCQRYEGHLNELKVLCDAVRQTNTSPRTASPERKPCSISFRELHDDKGFREFLELRDPLLTSRAARQRSCSPPKAPPPPPAPRARSPRELRPEPRRSVSGRMASTRLPEENNSEAAEDKPVIPPLLSAGVLSDTPLPMITFGRDEDSDLEHVRNLFATQVPEALVLGVYRVENPTLAGVYAAVRDAMGSECELDLWHGTSSECVPNIVLNGFNRAYSGRRHGTKLGHGCYFSASAAYSTKFCERKRPRRRTVFFAKVLVGAWAKGSPDLVEPPCRDKDGLVRFDSTVDDAECPVNFCIFRDFQAMPTYLLEFTV